jgi:hypothetical protein
VLLPDGTDVNHALIKDGWCWWYRKYVLGDTVNEAREGGKACGLICSGFRRGRGDGHEFPRVDEIRPISLLIALISSKFIFVLAPFPKWGYCFSVYGGAGFVPHYY